MKNTLKTIGLAIVVCDLFFPFTSQVLSNVEMANKFDIKNSIGQQIYFAKEGRYWHLFYVYIFHV